MMGARERMRQERKWTIVVFNVLLLVAALVQIYGLHIRGRQDLISAARSAVVEFVE